MTKKQWEYVNFGGVIAFGVFLLLSFVTAEAGTANRVMVLFCEIIGAALIVGAYLSIHHLNGERRFIPFSIMVFLSAWLVYAIGYEIGVDASTNYKWIWFLFLYIVLIAGFYFLRKMYTGLTGPFKLLPIFLLFINAILFVIILFFNIWWSLPFTG
ncbi:hypothetical protein [Halobacillus sp. K22]|uniref:hypothetical protein n=1 Tax=Halobacillus sp. K22 TaxID=3457431 RepID=UPI003FCCE957